MTRHNLFCIPYAGGAAGAIYGKWVQKLNRSINLIPLELSGHGRRMNEAFYNSLDAAVDDLVSIIVNNEHFLKNSFSFYAHSMGTVLAYEICNKLISKGFPTPENLFISGRQPPHIKYKKNGMHLLSDEIFINEIKQIGGTPEELFKSPELLKIFLPILKSDYKIIEEYQFFPPIKQLDSNLIFLFSKNDPLVTLENVKEWSKYTFKSFKQFDFEGGHFFINEEWQEICDIISHELFKTNCLT
ncbi:thioesterase II family protein [Shouchella hunanensis]|uniref:Thioesterase domain-containing protein n=1 Tax=Shouchella hunanensis TaxID=766894 RepID=A0ABY7W1W8_9BACI|nr:thioesterase domain-containing protein [Shouchella hunanensis]WDF02041.1 thioesterase domain-containing protein [Shouchella hunanensis]